MDLSYVKAPANTGTLVSVIFAMRFQVIAFAHPTLSHSSTC
ncbi:hypothetical protein PENARI_c050G09211 [Penicillium arizonense]|uniref:Uncharacterized protein n=1 Tax=Penicillium arizonense TaxID=1835702 RepID=A0A1F5L256_PENAI|nr:hypothetical protein PENARI_c050G09211 [Penicillium arizonense]OGE47313.1 hypothetical protein PENARI_c050G09211 [Penicillium arizonense]